MVFFHHNFYQTKHKREIEMLILRKTFIQKFMALLMVCDVNNASSLYSPSSIKLLFYSQKILFLYQEEIREKYFKNI